MIHKDALNKIVRIDQSRLVLPNYESYSFGNIMPTIFKHLTGNEIGNSLHTNLIGGKKVQATKVVLFFLDAFGWRFCEKYVQEHNVLIEIEKNAIMSPIFTLFPSSTAAAVNSLSYGVNPSSHGIIEARMFFPEYQEYMWTFALQPIIKDQLTRFENEDYAANADLMQLEENTIWEKFAQFGVSSHVFLPKKITKSIYNQVIDRGAQVYAYNTLSEGLVNLKNLIDISGDKNVFEFYWPDFDSIAHKYGPDSVQLDAEINSFWDTFGRIFKDLEKDEDTLYIITADHGQIECDTSKAFWYDKEIEGFDDYLKRDAHDNIIYPAGSGRDSFLFVREDRLDELKQLLISKLVDIAKVWTTQEALETGLFGTAPFHNDFVARLGDLIITPYENYLVWHSNPELGNDKKGTHGGLSLEETLTTLIVI